MNKHELAQNFESMTLQAKRLIKQGQHVQGFCEGIANFASWQGGKTPSQADYCLKEGKRRIEEIIKFAAELEVSDE